MSAPAGSNRLPMLQAEIRDAHRLATAAADLSIDRARQAGLGLIEAKAMLGHGKWLPWLVETGITARTAQRYMRLARIPADKYDSLSHLGIGGALDAIAASTITPLDRLRAAIYEETATLVWLLHQGGSDDGGFFDQTKAELDQIEAMLDQAEATGRNDVGALHAQIAEILARGTKRAAETLAHVEREAEKLLRENDRDAETAVDGEGKL
jgi:hypothetical protein